MHPAAYVYVHKALAGVQLVGKRILEIGAYNVNGSVRPLFTGCADYCGVDVRPGPGVDAVMDGRTLLLQNACKDVVVCCEVLEHAPWPWEIIAEAYRVLVPGGLLILTAANVQRPPHGCDGGAVADGEHYGGIDDNDLALWLNDFGHWTLDNAGGDIRVTARK